MKTEMTDKKDITIKRRKARVENAGWVTEAKNNKFQICWRWEVLRVINTGAQAKQLITIITTVITN